MAGLALMLWHSISLGLFSFPRACGMQEYHF
jgi:hypothetical protein